MLINHVQLKLGYIGKSHWVIHVVIAYLQTQMHIRALFLPFRGSELEDSGSGNLPHYRLDILVGGLEHVFFHNIWDVILPINAYVSEGLKPPTSLRSTATRIVSTCLDSSVEASAIVLHV
jgi:hypothetical protein